MDLQLKFGIWFLLPFQIILVGCPSTFCVICLRKQTNKNNRQNSRCAAVFLYAETGCSCHAKKTHLIMRRSTSNHLPPLQYFFQGEKGREGRIICHPSAGPATLGQKKSTEYFPKYTSGNAKWHLEDLSIFTKALSFEATATDRKVGHKRTGIEERGVSEYQLKNSPHLLLSAPAKLGLTCFLKLLKPEMT